MSLIELLRAVANLDGAGTQRLDPLIEQARALLAALAEQPDVAAMERRAADVLRLDTTWGMERTLARDVQTLLAERLRARTALEDAAPELKAIRERHAYDDRRSVAEREEQIAHLKDFWGRREQEMAAQALDLAGQIGAGLDRIAEREERLAEALKSAAAWEIRAQDSADRARRAEEERDGWVRAAEDRYDCHAGPGTTQPACGTCITCLQREAEGLEAERDRLRTELAALRARVDVPPRFSHNGLSDAHGNPWLTTEAKVAALWSCIQEGAWEDTLAHLFDLLHRFKGERSLEEAARIWGTHPQPDPPEPAA